MSRTPPQARIDESNRSLDQIRGYGDDNEVSSPIERLNRDGQGGLQIYSTTINVDIDDAEEESPVDERLDIKTIESILLRIESSVSSMGNRLAAIKRSQLDDTIQFQMPQRFGEATPIPASGLRSVMFSPSPAVITTATAITAQSVPLAALSPTTIESRRVPVAKYIKLTQSSFDIANKFCVSLGDKTFENVDQLEKALKESCLYTLADGSCLQPVPSTNNIGGHTPPSVLVVLTSAGIPRNIIIEEDDYFKNHSDNSPTLTLFSTMIKPDMNHLIIKALENESATELYLIIREYFKGHKHHHIEFARNALHHCKFTQHVDKDIYNLTQLITNLEEAQEAPLPEAQKMGALRGMMVDEQRLNLTQAFNWACLNKQQFEPALDTLMSMWNNIPYKTVSMAAVTSTREVKLCFRFVMILVLP